MNRLMEKTGFSGLVMAWRLATWPTNRSPLLVKPTTDGAVRGPSWFAMTVGWPASITATQEFVVPKSIPIIFPILQEPPQISVLNIRYGGAAALSGALAHHHYVSLVWYCQILLHGADEATPMTIRQRRP